ncbi:MAG: LarC family nickel insertion protein [Candidatus Omnitrophica bacterium]|nr:LarC family nickel insertion protein [Candidatus Omnitrophota bacterium]
MGKYLVLRTPSGISGDMLVTGLAVLSGHLNEDLEKFISGIGLRELSHCLKISEVFVDGISGWRATIQFPSIRTRQDGVCSHGVQHAKRTYRDIQKIVAESLLSERAKKIAETVFDNLARAEGEIHGIDPAQVSFHEIGSTDSILDVCLAAALFDRIHPDAFFCSPLPVCDGKIPCAHGILSSPAPATLKLLTGVPVYGIDSEGETVTPTAIALLKALNVRFGTWPAIRIEKSVRVYGSRILPNIPNGAIFALGRAVSDEQLFP